MTVIRWKRWAGAAAAAVAAYAALGFWAAPWAIRRGLAGYAHEQLHRQASVGDLRFNPFTLRLEAADLKLAEADGAPIFSVGRLVVEMRWLSLLDRAWRFAEIEFVSPTASVVIAPDGHLNMAELAAAAQRGRQPSTSTDTTMPRVVVDRFAIAGGTVDMQDRQAGYANTLTPIEFELRDFSTLPDRNDEHTFVAKSRTGGTFRWKGRSSVNPIRANGEFVLEDIQLPQYSPYLKKARASIASGKLSARLPYAVTYADGKLEARLAGAQLAIQDLVALDESASPALKLALGGATMQLGVQASQQAGRIDLQVVDAALALTDVAVAKGGQPPLKIARAGFEGGSLDLSARRANLERVYAEGGQLHVARDRNGAIDLAGWLPAGEAGGTKKADAGGGPAWSAAVRTVELGKVDLDVSDEASGVKLHVVDAHARLEGAGTDLKQPVKFDAGFSLGEGGQFAGEGSVVPASGAVQAQLKASKIALQPLQPLLSRYVKLKLAGGAVSAQGKFAAGTGTREQPAIRYDGSFDVAGLVLNETDGKLFAAWKSLGAERLTASVSPNRLDIPELRIAGADAKLIIEEDRSFNASRLLVKQEPAAAAPAPATAAAASTPNAEPFPVRIRRVRLQDAKLDFTDLSLRPQFSAKIHELGGVVNGLSTGHSAHAQIELDGRVDEYGTARVRGETSLAAPRDNTDVNVVFRNVDMAQASPYSMKFAGYRIAEGRISLDLQYRIRQNKLEGDNKIVIDRLTLGERVDSPDAMKLPLELAIAILKDSDGRIDLGLPVSGDLGDPQFSYGGIIWKAIANVLTKIVTAPFRALGAALGIDGDKLEAITFDAGSGKLQPPEREKLKQLAQILAKRAGLKVSVPGQYSPAADGAALRSRALRRDVALQAGIKLQPGEEAGPLDFGDRGIRSAVREVYAKRFGDAELDKAKKAAEGATPAASAASAAPVAVSTLPMWQRAAKMIQGEPQVADASAFYNQLRERLEREQPLPADALAQLGAERAKAIAAALAEAGADAARVAVGAAEAADSPVGKTVPLKLGLVAR